MADWNLAYLETFVPIISAQIASQAYLVRSYARPRGETAPPPNDHNWLVTEAILAATAKPPHFAPLSIRKLGAAYEYQGVSCSGFSNPAGIAVEEARRVFVKKAFNSLVSLGAGLSDLIKRGRDSQTNCSKQLMARLLAIGKQTEKVANDVSKALRRSVFASPQRGGS